MTAVAASAERSRHGWRARALGQGLALCAAALFLAGCPGRAVEWCDLQCDCEHCSEHEYEKCVIDVNEQLDVADAYGCTDQADRLYECAMDEGHCANDHWVTDDYCGGDWTDTLQCIDINSSIIDNPLPGG